jgi:hypothetical protein
MRVILLAASSTGAGGVVIELIALVLYVVPIIVALVRHRANIVQVVIVNLLLGWTVIGWIIALVMAFGTAKEQLHGI